MTPKKVRLPSLSLKAKTSLRKAAQLACIQLLLFVNPTATVALGDSFKQGELLEQATQYIKTILPELSQSWSYEHARQVLGLLEGDSPGQDEWEEMVRPLSTLGPISGVRQVTVKNFNLSQTGKSWSINRWIIGTAEVHFETGEERLIEFKLMSRGSPWQLIRVAIVNLTQ